jgi:hypothetical protein
MKNKNLLSILLIALFAIIVVSCSDDTVTGPEEDNRTPGKPDSAMATTTNDSTIRIKWKPSIDENDSAFVGYIVKMTGDNGVNALDTVPKNFNPLQVTGLDAGVIYTFEISALFKNGKSSPTTTISWSPAYRFTATADGVSSIKLYETASQLGSGIDAYDEDSKAPKTLTVANGEYWTLGLDTRNGALIVASPTKIDYNYPSTPGYTEISQDYWDTPLLNDIYDSQALNYDQDKFSELAIPLDQMTDIKNNLVIIIRTQEPGETDFHYAKVMIKKNPNGGWLFGNAPNRYLEVEISYQTEANVPYAKIGLK